MAQDLGMQSVEYIPNCARPALGIAPPGALVPGAGGPLWRSSVNMQIYDGLLRRRAALVSPGLLAPADYGMLSSIEEEMPLLILTNFVPGTGTQVATTNAPCSDRYAPNPAAGFAAVVTSRQIFIYNSETGSAWFNATPTYNTGTVTATNGSVNITGAGTAWLTRGISPYQFISIDGSWYELCTVVSDTVATLRSVFTGATAAGKAYTIRRTWNLARSGDLTEACHVSASLFNQNLYVAGRFLARADGQVAPCLIRVANVLTSAPVTTYLTGSAALTVGLDFITGLADITGVQPLQDGRIVMSGSGPLGPSTIFYSSNLDQTVWTVAPAGQTPVVHKEGAIHALGRIGEVLTLHYESGVVLAQPTNQSDPPLNYRPSAATEGCFAPRSLRAIGGVEYFVTSAGNVARFDLANSSLVGDDARVSIFLNGVTRDQLRTVFTGFNPNRNELTVYQGHGLPGYFATLDLNSGSWWPHRIKAKLSAAGEGDPFAADYQYGSCLVGVRSNTGSATEQNLLWTFSEGAITDALVNNVAGNVMAYQVETDDLDFGNPLVYKKLSKVVAWFRAHERFGAATQTGDVTVSASVDGGGSWVDVTKTVSAKITGETPIQFSFEGSVAGAGLLRIRVASGSTTTFTFALTRLRLLVSKHGDIDRVEL